MYEFSSIKNELIFRRKNREGWKMKMVGDLFRKICFATSASEIFKFTAQSEF
jgi:hypothetical protein